MKRLQFILCSLLLSSFFFTAEHAQAQLTVDAQEEVGIGTSTPFAKLDILSDGPDSYFSLRNQQLYSGPFNKYGIYSYVAQNGTGARYGIANITYGGPGNNGQHYGIYNYGYTHSGSMAIGSYTYLNSLGGNGVRYGIYNYLNCGGGDGNGTRYALYSGVSSNCGNSRYAGYFNGNVYVAGTVTSTSDASKKKNIQALTGALDIIGQLEPKTYDYIDDADLALPSEKQYGFLAQDLEKVLPELVKDVETLAPPVEVAEGEEGEMSPPEVTGTIKSVNYTALIPVLVEAIQELQAEVDALKAERGKQ